MSRAEKQSRPIKRAIYRGKILPKEEVLRLEAEESEKKAVSGNAGTPTSDPEPKVEEAKVEDTDNSSSGDEGDAQPLDPLSPEFDTAFEAAGNQPLSLKKVARDFGLKIDADNLTKAAELKEAINAARDALKAEKEAQEVADGSSGASPDEFSAQG